MAEKYEKNTAEIAAGYILSPITANNAITTVVTPAPKRLDTAVQIYENNECLNRIPATPEYLSPQNSPPELEKCIDSTTLKFKKTYLFS